MIKIELRIRGLKTCVFLMLQSSFLLEIRKANTVLVGKFQNLDFNFKWDLDLNLKVQIKIHT